MKHWNLDIVGYWVIGAVCEIEKDLKLSPSPPDCSKDSLKLLPFYLWIGQVWWLNKLWFKSYIKQMHPVLRTNTYHDVTDLVNDWMLRNTKIWISWERKITTTKKKFLICTVDDILWEVVKELTFNSRAFKYSYWICCCISSMWKIRIRIWFWPMICVPILSHAFGFVQYRDINGSFPWSVFICAPCKATIDVMES